ncbi:MAG TPA: sulfurtransferase TusA family protein [Thermoanaerobaculia bacterium]|nr:sulfurtransferase TusA family protein [Thermoanaerobaculia bacterium]
MSANRHFLDVTGTLCPLPILLAAREMRKLQPGDLLEIVGDDPGIREDMPVWCERAGHRLLEFQDEGHGRLRSLVEKGEPRQRRPPSPEPAP